MTRIVKQPDIRKQELLDIGAQLYFEAGEKGISIQQVVKQCGVATGLFYYYFKSKDAFLDEALNCYIDKEIRSIEVILEKSELNASQKLDAVCEAYAAYAEKMAPHRSCKAFHTERHYALSEKLIARLKEKVCAVLLQGQAEHVFRLNDAELTAGFVLHGLSSFFDADMQISEARFLELKQLIYKLLKVELG